MINTLQSIVLGLVQGLTEFLPISSSGHLLIIREIFNWKDPGVAFDAAIHIGTLLASIAVFWNSIKQTLKIDFKNPLKSDLVKVIIVSLPVLGLGYVLRDQIDLIKTPTLTAVMLILLGLLFLLFRGSSANIQASKFTLPDLNSSFLIGLSQVLAFLPGTSRSGVTILTGRFLKDSFDRSVKTSFILGIPIIAAAGLWGSFSQISDAAISSTELANFAIGIVTSFISGFVAGDFLKNKLSKIGLLPFGIYRIALGIAILVLTFV